MHWGWNRWTKQEVETLKEYYPDSPREELLKMFPTRTWQHVISKAKKIGIKRSRQAINAAIAAVYTPSEKRREAITRECYQRLGLVPIEKIDGNIIKELYCGQKNAAKAIAKQLRCAPNRLYERLHEMGIIRTREEAGKIAAQQMSQLVKSKRAITFRLLNQNPEFQSRRIKALHHRPSLPEKKLISIIQDYKLPYKYVGDGSFIIEGLNPDFVNVNGKKNIIEVFGEIWHKDFAHDWKSTELGRIMVFNSYGYKTLVIWDNELKDKQAVLSKIRTFEKGRR